MIAQRPQEGGTGRRIRNWTGIPWLFLEEMWTNACLPPDKTPLADRRNDSTHAWLSETASYWGTCRHMGESLLTGTWTTQRQLQLWKAHPSMSDSSQKMCPWSCLKAHSSESVLSLAIITVYRAQGWALENLVNFRNFMRLVSLLSSWVVSSFFPGWNVPTQSKLLYFLGPLGW